MAEALFTFCFLKKLTLTTVVNRKSEVLTLDVEIKGEDIILRKWYDKSKVFFQEAWVKSPYEFLKNELLF